MQRDQQIKSFLVNAGYEVSEGDSLSPQDMLHLKGELNRAFGYSDFEVQQWMVTTACGESNVQVALSEVAEATGAAYVEPSVEESAEEEVVIEEEVVEEVVAEEVVAEEEVVEEPQAEEVVADEVAEEEVVSDEEGEE